MAQRGFKPEAAAWATNYVEGFNAADAHRISVRSLAKQQAAEDAISGDRLFRVVEGYSRVPAFLLRRFLEAGGEWVRVGPGANHHLEAGVGGGRLPWTGRTFHAAAAIITLPLGVLQARRVAFAPQPVRDSRCGRPTRHGTGCARGVRVGPRLLVEFGQQPERRELSLRAGCYSPHVVDDGPKAGLDVDRLGSRPQSQQTEPGRAAGDRSGNAWRRSRQYLMCASTCCAGTSTIGRPIPTAWAPTPMFPRGDPRFR